MPVTLAERLEEGIYHIASLLPDLGLALGILLAGFAVATMVERGTAAFLRRVGFDRWMQEGGVTEALDRAGTKLAPSSVIAKLAFWTVMVLIILLAANALGLAVVSALFAELLAYIPHVLAAVIVLVLGLVLGEFLKNLVLASAGAVRGGRTLARAAKAAVIVLTVFMALEQIQIAEDIVLVAFMALVGAAALAAGIAFGLGGKDVAAMILREWYESSRAAGRGRPGESGASSPEGTTAAGGNPPEPSEKSPQGAVPPERPDLPLTRDEDDSAGRDPGSARRANSG